MKKLLADMHMHTIMSGHAYGTMKEMAQSGFQQGLKLIGITEHGPGIPGTCNPIYFENLWTVPVMVEGIEVMHGCEVNVLTNGQLSLDERHLKKLDYAIVGIHGLCYKDEGKQKNTDNVIECMKHEKVKFVSHPDDDNFPLDYERLVLAAKQYHVALEVNNSSLVKKTLRINCYENYKTMLKLCEKHQTYIIVDSDAHDPYEVGKLDLAQKLLEELNFNEELILNNDIKKLKEFIGIEKHKSINDNASF